jgi:hypothetical protein
MLNMEEKEDIRSVKEILDQIPEDIRKKLGIDDIDDNGFRIYGLETVIIVQNPIDIDIYEAQSTGEKQYTIKTKNGGQFVVTDSGSTFVTIV